MDNLSGIRLWDYKRESSENGNEQEVTPEESSKEGTSPRGAVLPDMMIIIRMINNGIVIVYFLNFRIIVHELEIVNDTATHSPNNEFVVKRTNEIVVIASGELEELRQLDHKHNKSGIMPRPSPELRGRSFIMRMFLKIFIHLLSYQRAFVSKKKAKSHREERGKA
ncbi:hypothetical protein TNCV_4155511 [Trichonephila clavipes]|nr:hypothetical protein TNCV_4155511 [Trichonephila clavipes]